MAWYPWPKPDDVRCGVPCEHTDCAEWRKELAEPCGLCGEPFKTDDRVQRDEGRNVHLVCNIKRVEAERASPAARGPVAK